MTRHCPATGCCCDEADAEAALERKITAKQAQDERRPLRRQLAEVRAEVERLRGAAVALVAKMRAVQDSDEYLAVWQSAQLHRGPYNGGKWEDELAALCAALDAGKGEP